MGWGRRLVGICLIVGAAAWGAEVMRQANAADDGGPPLGALCMALPSVILLIAAGAVLSARKPSDQRAARPRDGSE
jgi:hypothetical protein